MSRLDWKSGKFNADSETDRIFKGIRGWRDHWGDWLDYYLFDPVHSETDDIYDEAYGVGRIYTGPIKLDVMSVTHIEGGNENGDTGFYYNDDLSSTLSYDIFIRTGMTEADVKTGKYLKDRLIYDDKVFRLTQISIEGQIQRRDTIVHLAATQVKPDELVDDPQFHRWSA